MKRLTLFILLSSVLFLNACSIKQQVEPADIQSQNIVCIIEDQRVRESFLPALTKILDEKNVQYKIIPPLPHSTLTSCDWTSTYTARWSWDFTIYMSYAEIKVYHNGVLDGEAIYDSRWGGFRLDKWVDAEDKIRDMVDELIL